MGKRRRREDENDAVPTGADAEPNGGAAGDGPDDGGDAAAYAGASEGDGGPAARRARGVDRTVSIAVCSSMVDNAQSLELATLLAGQVARCAAIFCVDEVVVIDDLAASGAVRVGDGNVSSCAAFMARILQYMETPQYLRRALIPTHPHLRHVGLLPPLNAPHHPRATEWSKYREGVALAPADATAPGSPAPATTLVDVGLDRPALVHAPFPPGTRLTVRFKDKGFDAAAAAAAGGPYRGKSVSPFEPRRRKGQYWGYSVRLACSLEEALRDSPFGSADGKDTGGYDLKVGTSEHGVVLRGGGAAVDAAVGARASDGRRGGEGNAEGLAVLPPHRHLMIAFGAVDGLEAAMPPAKGGEGPPDPRPLFDMYVNLCPDQGTRTIRAEEAMLLCLAKML